MVHMLHRGAVQPNNASEHEFWPAVNRDEVELEGQRSSKAKAGISIMNKVVGEASVHRGGGEHTT